MDTKIALSTEGGLSIRQQGSMYSMERIELCDMLDTERLIESIATTRPHLLIFETKPDTKSEGLTHEIERLKKVRCKFPKLAILK